MYVITIPRADIFNPEVLEINDELDLIQFIEQWVKMHDRHAIVIQYQSQKVEVINAH